MADYNAAKATVQGQNQGWYNSEKTSREYNRNKAKTALDEVDPYYAQLMEDLNVNQGKATNSLQASMARRGLTRSGMRTRAEGNLATEYGKLNSNLVTEKTKQKNTAQADFDNQDKILGNLESDWNDKINTLAYNLWQTQSANELAQQNWEKEQASKNYGGGGGGATSDWVDSLEADIQKYVTSDRHYLSTGDTESRAIPQLVAKYSKYGATKDQIGDMLYAMRKPYEQKADRSKMTSVAWQGGNYDSWLR